MPTTPASEREVCVRELEAYLLKVRKAGVQHDQFIRGLEAARNLVAKEANEPWHGTPSGYNHHKCRRKCCRDAMTKYRNDLRGGVKPSSPPPRFDGRTRCSECFKWIKHTDALVTNLAGRKRSFCGEGCMNTFAVKRGEGQIVA